MKNQKRYRIEVSEEQLRLIINCVEDCSRFASGQVNLDNTRCCKNEEQKKFIAQTYYLYRELLHQLTVRDKNKGFCVYQSSTLRCADSGEPIKLEEIKEIAVIQAINVRPLYDRAIRFTNEEM